MHFNKNVIPNASNMLPTKNWLDDFHLLQCPMSLGNPCLSMQGHPLASTEPQKVLIHQTKDCSLTAKDWSRTTVVRGRCWTPIHRRKRSLLNEEIYSCQYIQYIHFVKTQRSCFVDFLPKHKFWSANVVVDLAWRFKLAKVQIQTFAGFHRILYNERPNGVVQPVQLIFCQQSSCQRGRLTLKWCQCRVKGFLGAVNKNVGKPDVEKNMKYQPCSSVLSGFFQKNLLPKRGESTWYQRGLRITGPHHIWFTTLILGILGLPRLDARKHPLWGASCSTWTCQVGQAWPCFSAEPDEGSEPYVRGEMQIYNNNNICI